MEVFFRQHANEVNVQHARTVGHKNDPSPSPSPVPVGQVGDVVMVDQEICEIHYDDGRVGAFPANEIVAGTNLTFAQTYSGQYGAFKSNPNKRRADQLTAELSERQAELDGLQPKKDEKNLQKPKSVDFTKTAPEPYSEPHGIATPDNPTGAVPKETAP